MKSKAKRSTPRRKRFHFAVSSLMLSSLLLLSLQQNAPATEIVEEAQKKKHINAAYVYDRKGLTFADRDAKNIDQLNYSFALLKKGRVSGDHWQSIDAFKAYIAKYPHIYPVLSVGGWGADGFSQAASTAEGRALFVKSAMELMQKHGFLGIDIDWEYPGSKAGGIASSSNDKKNFTLLLQELRAALDAQTQKDGLERRLCIAVGAVESLVDNIECAKLAGIVDQFNMMTYDLQTQQVASHHTPLYSGGGQYSSSADAAIRAYAKAGIPKEKMMLGAAHYGRSWKSTSTNGNALFLPASGGGTKTVRYEDIVQMISSGKSTRYFDETAKAPYLFDGKTFISYDDPESIAHKGAYVRANSLMGMMCWEYGGDPSGELLAAMRNSMK